MGEEGDESLGCDEGEPDMGQVCWSTPGEGETLHTPFHIPTLPQHPPHRCHPTLSLSHQPLYRIKSTLNLSGRERGREKARSK